MTPCTGPLLSALMSLTRDLPSHRSSHARVVLDTNELVLDHPGIDRDLQGERRIPLDPELLRLAFVIPDRDYEVRRIEVVGGDGQVAYPIVVLIDSPIAVGAL